MQCKLKGTWTLNTQQVGKWFKTKIKEKKKVPVSFGVKGPLSNPRITNVGAAALIGVIAVAYGAGHVVDLIKKGTQSAEKTKKALKQNAKKRVDDVKKKAKAQVKDKQKEAEAKAKKAKDDAKRKANAAKQKAKKKAKNTTKKATKALKGLF
jgi:hypothetical protein